MEARGSHIECPVRPREAVCKSSYHPAPAPNICHVLLAKGLPQASSDSKVIYYTTPLGGRISKECTALLNQLHIVPSTPCTWPKLAPASLVCTLSGLLLTSLPASAFSPIPRLSYHHTSFFQDIGMTVSFYYLGTFSGFLVDSKLEKGKHQVPFFTWKCPAPSPEPDT